MEDSLNNLSNLELRNRLISHGLYPGPVTDSTRKIYVSKLIQFESQNPPKQTSPVNNLYRNYHSFMHFDRNSNSVHSSTPETNGKPFYEDEETKVIIPRRSPRKPSTPKHIVTSQDFKQNDTIDLSLNSSQNQNQSHSFTADNHNFYSPKKTVPIEPLQKLKAPSSSIFTKMMNQFPSYKRQQLMDTTPSPILPKKPLSVPKKSYRGFLSGGHFNTFVKYGKKMGLYCFYLCILILVLSLIYPFLSIAFKSLDIALNILFLTIISIGALITALCLGVFTYRRYRKHKNDHSEEVYKIVQIILERASTQLSEFELGKVTSPYLVVPHMRDLLFGPADRTAKAPIWNDVVKFIEEYESRIRPENKIIAGQEFRVWKWIGATQPTPKPTPVKKDETLLSEDNGRGLSPCLKIYILDHHQGEVVSTIDALTAKIKSFGVHMVHFHYPSESSKLVVYTKLATTNEAIKVYRALNTTSIMGRFIKVKFVKQEQYSKRFPNIL